MKKIKGEATIILKNAKTGAVEYQKKHNIVTNLPGLATSYIPYGFGNFCPSLIDLMGGMLLFSAQNQADENNNKLTQIPIGWSGIDTTAIANSGKGVLLANQCSYDGESVTIAHEWGTSQANGTISSISLTNPASCVAENYLGNACFWTYGPSILVNGAMASDNVQFKNQLGTVRDRIGHILHVDVENGLYYEMQIDGDYKTLHFRKIRRSPKNLLLNEVTHAEYYNIKGSNSALFSTNLSTLIDERTFELTNAMDWNSNEKLTNSFHYDYDSDTMYIFSLYQDYKIEVTKLEGVLNGFITETTSELDLTNIFSANAVLGSGIFWYCRHIGSSINRNQILIKDALAFDGTYLYIQAKGVKMIKLNITDLTDYRILDLDALYYNTGVNGAFINDGNLFYGKTKKYTTAYNAQSATVIINMLTDEIKISNDDNDRYNYSSTYNGSRASLPAGSYSNNEFCKINDAWYLEYNTQFSGEASSYDTALVSLVLNPMYMATINNLTPFLKTSQQTLTITYTLREVDE